MKTEYTQKIATALIVSVIFFLTGCLDAPKPYTHQEMIKAGDGYVIYKCHTCNGNKTIDCSTCDGKGEQKCVSCDGEVGNKNCPTCKGKGEYTCPVCKGKKKVKCWECNGTGEVRRETNK